MDDIFSKYVIGQSSGKTQNGISLSLLKSAIQKYIRRSEHEKIIMCLHEIETLLLLEVASDEDVNNFNKQNKQKNFNKQVINGFGKANRTNVANRLLVICSEDVNIHDSPNLPVRIFRLYNQWQNERRCPSSVNYLIEMALLLSNAKKCRMPSYLKSAYNLPPYYVKSKDIGKYNDFYQDVILDIHEELAIESASDVYDMNKLTFHIREKNREHAFRCLGEICRGKNESETKKILTSIWKIVLEITNSESVRTLHTIYKLMTHQEKPIYLYHAILLIIHRNSLDFDLEPALPCDNINRELQLRNINDIGDSYVIDQHVKGEKTLNSHIKLIKESFVIDKAHVNKRFMNKHYENMYRDIKIGIGYFVEHKKFPNKSMIQYYVDKYFGSTQAKTVKHSDTANSITKTKKNTKIKIKIKVPKQSSPKQSSPKQSSPKQSSPKQSNIITLREMEAQSKLRTLNELLNVIDVSLKKIEVSDKFTKYLETLPLAQRRTGRGKKFVYIDFNETSVIKGPYTENEITMINALKYNEALQTLDNDTKTNTHWPWTSVLNHGSKFYLVSPFVSENYEKDEDVRNSMMVENTEKWTNGKTYKCFERDSKVLGYRLKDYIDEGLLKERSDKNNKIKNDTVQHLYLRYILGIGDTSASNIIIVDRNDTQQLIAGIDLEEFREKYNGKTVHELLFASAVKKQVVLFADSLKYIKFVDWNNVQKKFETMFTSTQIESMKQRDKILRLMLSSSMNGDINFDKVQSPKETGNQLDIEEYLLIDGKKRCRKGYTRKKTNKQICVKKTMKV